MHFTGFQTSSGVREFHGISEELYVMSRRFYGHFRRQRTSGIKGCFRGLTDGFQGHSGSSGTFQVVLEIFQKVSGDFRGFQSVFRVVEGVSRGVDGFMSILG